MVMAFNSKYLDGLCKVLIAIGGRLCHYSVVPKKLSKCNSVAPDADTVNSQTQLFHCVIRSSDYDVEFVRRLI